MHLPDRSGFPRWARLLTSPWLLSPLLVFALLIGAFLGYGAYSRSKPTHYDRGGDVFAAGVIPDESAAPVPGASARPSVSAAPGAAAAHRNAVSGSGAVSRPQQPSGPTSGPTRLPGAPGVVLPATGAYRLAISGSENVKFGFVPGCHNTFPTTGTLAVGKASGESPTS